VTGPIVVVGASLAGVRAAETLRAEGFDGRLTIVGEEPHAPYDRPPLSKELLAGWSTPTDVALGVDPSLDADWRLGCRALALDVERRVLATDRGDVAFDGLVIATGVRPRTLPGLEPVPGEIFTLRTLDDALALREALTGAPRVLIVGAGFIGVEVATSARALGCAVTVVSLDSPVAVAGAEVSRVCARLLENAGVRVHAGRRIAELSPGAVALDDGTRVAFDVAVVAVGATPNVEWLAGSGLTLDDGVVCDASCAAVGVDRVVAAGDVARWPNPLFGGAPMRVEHWTNAVEQGAAAARTLLHGSGPHTAHGSVPGFWSDHCGTRLQSVGLPALGDRLELVDGTPDDGRFAAAAYAGDRLVGAVTYGIPRALVRYRIELARPREAVA
jgi:3-phenylpropionate/trans-cinnamate dioxygenase ferredoxin reductase subunit